MAIRLAEIQERWLAGGALEANDAAILDAFQRAERILGRPWLEAPLAEASVGPAITLPIYCVGEALRVVERARGAEKLITRVRERAPSALSELHALAVCVGNHPLEGDSAVEIEIEPLITVRGGHRVPDFRLRREREPWVHVEVTAPTQSESAAAAECAATRLAALLPRIPYGVTVHVRFRDEPIAQDIEDVIRDLTAPHARLVVDR